MRSIVKWRLWLLLLLPVFSGNVCGRHYADDIIPLGDRYVTWRTFSFQSNLTTPADSIGFSRTGSTSVVYGTGTANTKHFYLSFNGQQSTGNYNSIAFSLVLNGRYYIQTGAPLQINVSQYGSQGQYITGSYGGIVKDSLANTTIAISGEFRAKYQ